MARKLTSWALHTFVLFSWHLLGFHEALALESQQSSSAQLISTYDTPATDSRAVLLASYLKSHKSVLAPFASDFIEIADKYGLDWRILPSIAGIESSFGKHYPQGSHNVFGWGIYGDQVLRFKSFPDAMEAVAKGLTQVYPAQALQNYKLLGRIYNGVTPDSWTSKLYFFIDKISSHPLPLSSLAPTL